VYKEITSVQNPLVKEVLQLQEKSRTRKKLGLFVVEGQRELELALKGNYKIKTLFFAEAIVESALLANFDIDSNKIINVSKEVYHKLAFRNSTEGIIALVESKQHAINELVFKREHPLILVAEAPEKPGNIGALLRTADAANVDAVLIANPKTDLYNPNIIRSSVGCVFTNQVATGTSTELIEFLKNKNIAIFCAALTASESYEKVNFKNATAIVVGTEATGLSNEWLENSTQNIIIPMQGEIDSLNVSVSAAILLFEAKRQRNFK
tara:strand:+ start:373341 stop:374138 length:798 start_codon:yes stop_codon:yes gene_type:complete